MKYFKVFETTTDQQSYLNGDMITPCISITRDNESTINYVPEVIESNLITFYIDGTQYEAEEGMNWYNWVNSEYNTIGAEVGYGDHKMVILNGKELKDPNTLDIYHCVVWRYNNGDDAPIITENTLYYFANPCSPF